MAINQKFFKITAILFACFDLITFLFTITVVIVIIAHWRTQCRSTANLLACNSCAALLFYTIANSIQIPFILHNNQLYSSSTIITFCQIRAFLITCATAVKAYSYLNQAVFRFFIAFHPQRRFLLTFRCSWIASGIIVGGMFISPLAYESEPESHICTLSTRNFRTSFLAVVLIFFVTISITIILYGIIVFYTMRHNRINPDSASTVQARGNMKVSGKIFIFINILVIGGTPYLLCMILNVIGGAPWSLYSISILVIAFAAAVESIALLFTNEQVKKILFAKLCCCCY